MILEPQGPLASVLLIMCVEFLCILGPNYQRLYLRYSLDHYTVCLDFKSFKYAGNQMNSSRWSLIKVGFSLTCLQGRI